MPTEKAEALVIRVVEFSESSAVVTLFTREFGKVHALAKGARRPKGPFESSLDLLAHVRIVFLRKTSEALDLLTEAKLERRFRALGTALSGLYGAYYVAELLNELTDDSDPHPDLFDLAVTTLARLGCEQTPAADVLRFELGALRILGHLPSLRNCVECGSPISSTRRVAFGLLDGGVLCEACRPGKKQIVSISNASLIALQALAEGDVDAASVDRRNFGELRGVVGRYVCHLLGRKPRLHDYLVADRSSS